MITEKDNWEKWLERQADNIVDAYRDSIESISDVPDSFIESYADKHYESDMAGESEAKFEAWRERKMEKQ